jgi:hypothetical protein
LGEPLRIKPHHFVDIIADYGAGEVATEPSPYGHAVHTVTARLLADRRLPLVLEFGADDICRPCKHNLGGLCDDTIDISRRPQAPTSKQEYNLLLDRRWCARLNLSQGDTLAADELCQRLAGVCEDLGGIYAEEPPDLVARKAAHLKAGLKRFLGQPEDSEQS